MDGWIQARRRCPADDPSLTKKSHFACPGEIPYRVGGTVSLEFLVVWEPREQGRPPRKTNSETHTLRLLASQLDQSSRLTTNNVVKSC